MIPKDWECYAKILPIHLTYIMTFALAGGGKVMNFAPTVGYFTKKFETTFLVSLPGGMGPQVAAIAGGELIIVAVLVVSLIKGEFLPNRDRLFLKLGIFGSSIMFLNLGFGMRLVRDHSSAASLFTYFALTQLLFFAICHSCQKEQGKSQ